MQLQSNKAISCLDLLVDSVTVPQLQYFLLLSCKKIGRSQPFRLGVMWMIVDELTNTQHFLCYEILG